MNIIVIYYKPVIRVIRIKKSEVGAWKSIMNKVFYKS